jgi:hypothetical protein
MLLQIQTIRARFVVNVGVTEVLEHEGAPQRVYSSFNDSRGAIIQWAFFTRG